MVCRRTAGRTLGCMCSCSLFALTEKTGSDILCRSLTTMRAASVDQSGWYVDEYAPARKDVEHATLWHRSPGWLVKTRAMQGTGSHVSAASVSSSRVVTPSYMPATTFMATWTGSMYRASRPWHSLRMRVVILSRATGSLLPLRLMTRILPARPRASTRQEITDSGV